MLGRILHVLVGVLDLNGDASVALGTVEEVFPPTSSAHSTFFAVILLLRQVVIEEVALLAEVLAEDKATCFALVRDRLDHFTVVTLHLSHTEPVEFVDTFYLDCFSISIATPAYFVD